jgi:hypothetical protein
MAINVNELHEFKIKDKENECIEKTFKELEEDIDNALRTKYISFLRKGKRIKLVYNRYWFYWFNDLTNSEYLMSILINKLKESYTNSGWNIKIKRRFYSDSLYIYFTLPKRETFSSAKNKFEILDLEK